MNTKMDPRVGHGDRGKLQWQPGKRNRIAQYNGRRRRHRCMRRRKRRRGRGFDCLRSILEVRTLALGDQLDAIVDTKRPPDGDRSRNRRACIALRERDGNTKHNPAEPAIAKPRVARDTTIDLWAPQTRGRYEQRFVRGSDRPEEAVRSRRAPLSKGRA